MSFVQWEEYNFKNDKEFICRQLLIILKRLRSIRNKKPR
jgi:hypothetical protein